MTYGINISRAGWFSLILDIFLSTFFFFHFLAFGYVQYILSAR